MSPESAGRNEPFETRLYSSDRITLLFANLPNEELHFGRKFFLHGAFRDLCQEYPEFFPDYTFGKPGGWVNSDGLDHGFSTLMFRGLVNYIGPDLDTLRIRTTKLKTIAPQLSKLLDKAGAPELSEWEQVGQRFAELVEVNKQKEPSELIIFS